MTVYDFMEKMGRYEKFRIVVDGVEVTSEDEPTTIDDLIKGYEERQQVIDALERELRRIDAIFWILYC